MASENKGDDKLEDSDCSSGDDGGGAADQPGNKKRKVTDGGSGGGGGGGDQRKLERRAANRRSAFQSRQRRKILIEDLQKTVATLSKDNTELRSSNSQLRAKLETAMLENQLLRKQQGPAAATGTEISTGGIGPGATTAAAAASVATATHSPPPPTSNLPAVSIGGGPTSDSIINNNISDMSNPSGGAAGAPAPTSSGTGTNRSNQGMTSSQILNQFNLNGSGACVGESQPTSNTDPLLAARLALATGTIGNISSLADLNAICNHRQQHQPSQHHPSQQASQQQSQANIPSASSSVGLGGRGGGGVGGISIQLQQQLAMLLAGSGGSSGGGGGGMLGSTDQTQQQLALLQAALGRSPAPANITLSQAMRALTQIQAGSSSAPPN